MSACVYWIRFEEHTDPFTQGYIGVARSFERRMSNHFRNARLRKGQCGMLERIIQTSYEKIIVGKLVVASIEYCLDLENKLRPVSHTGWNILAGGLAGALGHKRNPEVGLKIAASKVGKPRSVETRAKLSVALKGNKCAKGSVRTEAMKAAHSERMKSAWLRKGKDGYR